MALAIGLVGFTRKYNRAGISYPSVTASHVTRNSYSTCNMCCGRRMAAAAAEVVEAWEATGSASDELIWQLLEHAERLERDGAFIKDADAIVIYEFTHTTDLEPGPVNRFLACKALRLWHGELGQQKSIPILAPTRVARAVRETVAAWPCAGSPDPHVVDIEEFDEYRRLIDCRSTNAENYALGITAAICRALLHHKPGIPCSELTLALVSHRDHVARWAALLQPTLLCRVAVLPQPDPDDLDFWGLDKDGYWDSACNPQPWTHSLAAFAEYECARIDAFGPIAKALSPFWRCRTWEIPYLHSQHSCSLPGHDMRAVRRRSLSISSRI